MKPPSVRIQYRMIRAYEELLIVGLRDTGVRRSHLEQYSNADQLLDSGDGIGVDRLTTDISGDGWHNGDEQYLDGDGDGATRDTIVI